MDNNLKTFPNGPTGLFEPFDQVARDIVGSAAAGRDVLRSRIVPTSRARTSRQALAARHASTFTAIRRCEQTLRRMVDEPDDTVKRIVADIYERGGAAIPTDMAVRLAEPADTDEEDTDPAVVLHLLTAVGPWKLQNEWLTDPTGDPTDHIIEEATRTWGRVDPDTAAEALTAWGLRPEWQQQWLSTRKRLRTTPSEDLIVWNPAKYRYTYGLALLARPSTSDEIQQAIGCVALPTSAKTSFA